MKIKKKGKFLIEKEITGYKNKEISLKIKKKRKISQGTSSKKEYKRNQN